MKIEEVILDKNLTFEQKIPTLISIWNRLKNLIHNPQGKSIERLLDWAQNHTLNFVLHGDWTSQPETIKSRLLKSIIDFDAALVAGKNKLAGKCKKIIEVVQNPWGDPILTKILNEPQNCTKEEELTYFASEHGYLVAMRLKKLCDSRCEDLALRFSNACLRCLRSPESSKFHVVTTEDQHRYILDIYIALLNKYMRTYDIIYEFKNLSLQEGLSLVARFTNKRVELSRVWRHCSRIAELAAQFFITAAMTKPVEEIETILGDLLRAWIYLINKGDGIVTIPTVMRKIIQTADSAAHIYICCEVLHKSYGEKIKSFTIELYIRALTTDMNEMEKQKSRSEDDKVLETSKRLSRGFLSLADLLDNHWGVSRECVLTSFSLNPSRSCLEKIEKLAIACGKAPNPTKKENGERDFKIESGLERAIKIDGRIKTERGIDGSLELLDTGQCSQTSGAGTVDALILIKGAAVTGCKNYDVLSAPNQVLNAEALGLSEQLCDDLAVVLSSPRYQLLSWVLDWTELKTTCDKYLSNAEGTRNTVKELKYLNIDYNQFKDWPSDEDRPKYGGIEKGYEQWADVEEPISNHSTDYQMLYTQDHESDCSTTTVRDRRRRKAPRVYSSESEYDSVDRKVDSHGSDIDTASQDADSLGSDGLQQTVPPASKRGRKKSTNLSHFAMLMNAHNHSANNNPTTYTNEDMMSIFARIDEPPKGKEITISKPSYVNPKMNPQLQQLILPEKRSSDPKVLRNLRMFRAKKRVQEDMALGKNTKNASNKKHNDSSDSKFAKLTSMPHMNPRVLLDRQEFNNYINNKNSLHNTIKQEIANLVKKRDMESTENKHLNRNNLNNNCNSKFNKLNMNPCVLLDRYDDIQNMYKHSLGKKPVDNISDTCRGRKRRKLDVLADVPGLNSLEMIRPAIMHPTVQVVQLSSNQITSQQLRTLKTATSTSVTSTITNSITSTPVTAHIQRVGQPRQTTQEPTKISRPPEESTGSDNTSSPPTFNQNIIIESQTSTSSAISNQLAVATSIAETPALESSSSASKNASSAQTTQSTPTLVNILSQQIIRPAQGNSVAANRSPTLINILSQQIIRPSLSQSVPIVCVSTAGLQSSIISNTSTSVTTTVTTQAQNSLKLVTTNSSQHQILQQLFNAQGKNNNQVLKNVNLVTGLTNSQASVDTSRLVQFLCKTDGKMIQLTPYSANSNIKLQPIDSSKLVKTTSVSTIATTKTVTTVSLSSSPVSPTIPARSGYEENYAKFIQTSGKTPPKNAIKEATNSSEAANEQANSLPKFQQAFGKTVYQTSSSSSVESATPNTNTVNVSLQGGSLVTSSHTSVTAASVNSITVNPQHLQLTAQNKNSNIPNATVVSASTSANATATAVATIPVIGAANIKTTTVPPLGVQAIQGGVIYTRQVPVSLAVTAGQTINLISNANVAQAGRNQVFRITSATGEPIKDTVIRSKMSALLAAALQSGVPNRSIASCAVAGITTTSTTVATPSPSAESTIVYSNQQETTTSTVEPEVCEVDSSSNDSCNTSATSSTTSTSTLVTPMRIALPMMQRTATTTQGTTRIVRPVLQIPGSMIQRGTGVRQQVVLASAQSVPLTTSTVTRTQPQAQPQTQTQTVAIGENLVAHNSMEPMVSSTTLEQLREFDLVLEQVKERSTTTGGPPTPRPQLEKSATATIVNQSTSSDLQEVISNVNVSYINQSQLAQKVSPCAQVVVVTSYCNIQSAASPALSVTSQSSSSPCVTPAPSSSGSIGKTVPKSTSKSSKSKTVKTTTTHASKSSPVPKPQQKPQEDEQTTQRIFDILAEYAEQLRNSPDLNNKPAPRRRSNPPTNPSQNSKRKKSSGAKKTVSSHCNSMASDMSPGADDPRTIGSEDSSCGVVQISVQDSPSQGAPISEDHQSTQGSSDFSSLRQHTESNDATSDVIENQLPTSGRQFIFTDSNTNQSRNVIIADSTVNEALGKISNTAAVIVPANYIAVVSGNSKILATVPARTGSNQMLLFQSFVNQARKPVPGQTNVKAIKYSTLQPIQGISQQTLTGVTSQPVVLPSGETTTLTTQTLTIKNSNSNNTNNSSNENATASESDTISTSDDILLNVGTNNDITSVAISSDTSKPDDKQNLSSVASHLVTGVENGESVTTQLDHSIKVLPLCTETISLDDSNEKSVEKAPIQTTPVAQNTFSINFASKTTPTVLNQSARTPVIEKNLNSVQDSNTPKKITTPGLPTLGEKSTTVRTVIENKSTAKSIAASGDMSFSQMDCSTSVDHFSKVKSQTNTNGPMLSQSEPGVNRDIIIADSRKDNVHEKVSRELDSTPYVKPKAIKSVQRTEKELQQVQQRKQAALEREIHLQKSLSEECEDLGVDEPSTSDLFPEADLLFDSNNSPSFDQLSQDADKRYNTSATFHNLESSCGSSMDDDYKKNSSIKILNKQSETFMMQPHGSKTTIVSCKKVETITSSNACNTNIQKKKKLVTTTIVKRDGVSPEKVLNLKNNLQKEKEPAITLFSDEDNSDSLRTDLLFENLDYPTTTEVEYGYNERKIRQNCSKDGITLQSSTSNYTVSSYDEHTLMSTCQSILEVCSPIHYDIHSPPSDASSVHSEPSESPPPVHKYKYKYCNRKKMMNLQNNSSPAPKSPEKNESSESARWHPNSGDVIDVLSSGEETSQETNSVNSANTECAKSYTSPGSSPNNSSDRKRAASPAWVENEENNDVDSNNSSSSTNFKPLYNSNKILKLSVEKLVEPIQCANQQKAVGKLRRNPMQSTECSMDSSVVNTTPPSPLSPSDGELSAFGVGRGARRSTQRAKKNCHCCTSPEKPKKRSSGSTNIKKIPKGQITKKR